MRFECQSCLNVFEGKNPTQAGPCPRCGSTYAIIAPTGSALTSAGADPAQGSAVPPPAPPPATPAAPSGDALFGSGPTMAQPLTPPPGDPGMYAPAPQAAYPVPPSAAAPAGFGSPPAHQPFAPSQQQQQPPQPQYFGQNPFGPQGNIAPAGQPQYGAGNLPAEPVNTQTAMILGIVSIVSGFMCCIGLPLGIFSVVLAQQASDAVSVGDIARAKDRVRTSIMLSVVSLGLPVLGGIGYALLVLFAIVAR